MNMTERERLKKIIIELSYEKRNVTLASGRQSDFYFDGKQTTRALRSVHARFYLSPHTVSIGLVGPGVVGSVLLEQIASQAPRLLRDFRLDLRVRGLMTSKKMILSDQPIGGVVADGSGVVMAWFQDTLEPFLSEYIRQEARKARWDQIASNFEIEYAEPGVEEDELPRVPRRCN